MSLPWRTATLALIIATATAFIISLSAQASDPLAGTWELNVAKSKSNNHPLPKSQTRTYEVAGQQEKMILKGTNAKGMPTSTESTGNRDGKDYPYTDPPRYETISVTSVDALTATYTLKKAGKVVATGTRVISKDGKEMTLSTKGTDAKGQPWEADLVFDKR